ncbi:type II toxin-antitoxin system RelB family antitoxin [Pseudomonas sp. 18175]|uniref:type II toxin-antitoxin system RelB family antitoxin n=1 Tax=Pseudomonas sp. 18175 TaxID=3390056 RepID=UPI003D218F90
MSIPLSPIVSEFETEEQAASYDRWFRAKVQASIDDPRPSIPHDEAMAEVERILEERRKARRAARLIAVSLDLATVDA